MRKLFLIFLCMPLLAGNVSAQKLKGLLNGLKEAAEVLSEITAPAETGKPANPSATSEKTQQPAVGEISSTGMPVDVSEVAPVPFVTDSTVVINKDVIYNSLSDVYEGIFSILEKNKSIDPYKNFYSFYSVEGECVFPAMWESGVEMPRFNSGAAVVKYPRKMKPKTTHAIIYADGYAKDLSVDYRSVSQFYDGLALVEEHVGSKIMMKYINTKGDNVYPHLNQPYKFGMKGPMTVKNNCRYLRDNRRAYLNYETGLWGYIDGSGKIVIEPKYKEVRDFSGGYALVISAGDKTEFIDTEGKTVSTLPSVPTLYYAEKYGNLDSGIFSKYELEVTYHDVEGTQLAKYPGGKPFHKGYAFVNYATNEGDYMCVVDRNFKIVRLLGSNGVFLPQDKFLFNSNDLATVGGRYLYTFKGDLLLRMPKEDGNKLGMVSDEGFAKAYTVYPEKEKKRDVLGVLNAEGEYLVIFDSSSSKKTDPAPIGPIVKPAIYDIAVVPFPAEGGTVSGSGKYEYGDTVYVSGKANTDWFFVGTEASSLGMATEHPLKFVVRGSGTVTVNFGQKSEPDDKNLNGGAFVGEWKIVGLDGSLVGEFPIYFETGKVETPYKSESCGVFAPMVDPKHTIHNVLPENAAGAEELASVYNTFFCPFNVKGTKTEGGKRYLMMEGGAQLVANMTVLSTGSSDATLDMLNTAFANFVVRFEGFNDFSVTPAYYRIEMRDIDPSTGEFTLGLLERYSPTRGWLPSNTPHFYEHFRGLMAWGVKKGLEADIFEGVRMKKAQKREVEWYPPADFQKETLGGIYSIAEELGKQYREFISDYGYLRDLNLYEFSPALDKSVFEKF